MAGGTLFAAALKEKVVQEPTNLQAVLWSAARSLGWSPFDQRLLALSTVQMEWAILMADAEKRQELSDQKNTDRDAAAVLLLEWCRRHVTRG